MLDEPIPVMGGLATVPLRQIASLEPAWHDGQLGRRNGIPTVTVIAETARGVNVMSMTAEVGKRLSAIELPEGVVLSYGGELEENNDTMPDCTAALAIAIVLIFLILLTHFKHISEAGFLLSSLVLCLFGASLGVLVQGVDFGVTCIMGLVALMGIIVRNGIIMLDYAHELQAEGMSRRAVDLSLGPAAHASDFPHLGGRFDGCHPDDSGRQRPCGCDGHGDFLRYFDYDVLHFAGDSRRLHAIFPRHGKHPRGAPKTRTRIKRTIYDEYDKNH